METSQALNLVKQLIDAAVGAGLFKNSQDVVQLNDAYMAISVLCSIKSQYERELDDVEDYIQRIGEKDIEIDKLKKELEAMPLAHDHDAYLEQKIMLKESEIKNLYKVIDVRTKTIAELVESSEKLKSELSEIVIWKDSRIKNLEEHSKNQFEVLKALRQENEYLLQQNSSLENTIN
jgi:hypothetical protein